MDTTLHRVVIYHDETKDVPERNFKGHVLLFVPIRLSLYTETPLFGTCVEEYSPQDMLFDELMKCRERFSCQGKLHFAEISGQTWTKYDFAYWSVVNLAVDALRSKSPGIFRCPLHCKLGAIFYPKGADWNIYGGNLRKEQELRHDETLLRILLKGACHYLYDDANPIEVVSIISDGIPAHRQLDEDRVLWRLTVDDLFGRSPLRDYVCFSSCTAIRHLSSDHREYERDTEEYVHANLLQLADLLLGSVMRACYKGIRPRKVLPHIGDKCKKKDVIAQPVLEMLEKRKRGVGFRHSGHYRSFAITQVSFDKGKIHFQEPRTIQIQDEESLQMLLPMD